MMNGNRGRSRLWSALAWLGIMTLFGSGCSSNVSNPDGGANLDTPSTATVILKDMSLTQSQRFVIHDDAIIARTSDSGNAGCAIGENSSVRHTEYFASTQAVKRPPTFRQSYRAAALVNSLLCCQGR